MRIVFLLLLTIEFTLLLSKFTSSVYRPPRLLNPGYVHRLFEKTNRSINKNAKIQLNSRPKCVFFLAKPDPDIYDKIVKSIQFLTSQDVSVVVEHDLYTALPFLHTNPSVSVFNPQSLGNKQHPFDFIVTFGGDGLLLHVNTLFADRAIPPVMSFYFGSLGFLCPFAYEDFEKEIDRLLRDKTAVITFRMRLQCTIHREGESRTIDSFTVLNEAVVDRGPSPFLSVLDLSCDTQHITTSQGDGVIFATPTGSTAYSLAAGGSIVFPSVPAILLTPVCPHTLSFRPMLLPDSAVVCCHVPSDSRGGAWASFDGKHRQELVAGDRLEIRTSRHPLPTINRENHIADWTEALKSRFMFNVRSRQKPLWNTRE